MSAAGADAEIERRVEEWIAERDESPGLTPEAFAARHPGLGPRLLAAIHGVIEAEAALRGENAPPRLPERLAGWRAAGMIGGGGMGTVLALERDGERAALKLLRADLARAPRARARFAREAEALLRLDHPGVVRVLAEGASDPRPWILLERVEGVPLDAAAAAIDPLEAARILRDVARALAAAHERGLLHRDLKPSNVILRPDGRPIVLDFGLASDDEASTLTATGDLIGTPAYMAPEQALGRPADVRSDVYAIGLMLLEMISGHPAREGRTREEQLAAASRGLLPRSTAGGRGPRVALERIARKAAARHPAHRYQTAVALADDLDRVLEGRAPLGRPPGIARLAVAAIAERPRAAAIAVLLAATIGIVAHRSGASDAEGRDAAARIFDQGLAAWASGHEERAKEALAELESAHAGDARADRLRELLEDGSGGRALDDVTRLALEGRRLLDAGRAAAAFQALQKAQAAAPRSIQVVLLLAQAARSPAEIAAARAAADALVADDPRSAAVAGARAHLMRKSGELAAAEAEIAKGLAIDPASASLHHEHARILHASGRVPEAVLAAREAASLAKGENLGVLNNLAAFLDLAGDSKEAETIYRDLCSRFPASGRTHFNLAIVLDRRGEVVAARPLYEKAIELEPGLLDARLALAWLLATADSPGPGDPAQADRILLEELVKRRGSAPKLLRLVSDLAVRRRSADPFLPALRALLAGDLPDADRKAIEDLVERLARIPGDRG